MVLSEGKSDAVAASAVTQPHAAPGREELIRVLERSEVAVWLNLWRAVPVPVAAEAGLRAEMIGSATALILETAPTWMFNRVIGAGLAQPMTEADIDRMIGMYRAKGIDFAVSLSPLAQPTQAACWLEQRGFEVVNRWAKMYRGSAPPPVIETELRIEKVGHERAAEVGEVVCAGFGVPAAWQPIFSAVVDCDANHVFMAFDGDLPAGMGVLTVNDGVGHVNTAATLPQFRGRGIQGALMAHRIREGLKLGCTAFATETGLLPNQVNHSYNNMLRCDFRMAYERPNYLYRCAKA